MTLDSITTGTSIRRSNSRRAAIHGRQGGSDRRSDDLEQPRPLGAMSPETILRRFARKDATEVRTLFIAINRLLAPPHLRDAFEDYIALSLTEEIDRIQEYYAEREGGFWVAIMQDEVVGMFGLERAAPDAFELRRMYVAPTARRGGIARSMLAFAESECRRQKIPRLILSTSELQSAALELYRKAGYQLLQAVTTEQASNKSIGAGILRYHFEKHL